MYIYIYIHTITIIITVIIGKTIGQFLLRYLRFAVHYWISLDAILYYTWIQY